MDALAEIEKCRVTYHVPAVTDRSAMPVGNGELCASVWTTKDAVYAYLSRTDALTETDRTVKLGRIRIALSPNPFAGNFIQTLVTDCGCITVSCADADMQIWVEKGQDVFRVRGEFSMPVKVSACYETWRTEPRIPYGCFQESESVMESADVVNEFPSGTLFYHQNGENLIGKTAELESVPNREGILPDLLTGRIFGGLLQCISRENGFEVSVITVSAQQSLEEFRNTLFRRQKELCEARQSLRITQNWWQNYWRQSYVFVHGDLPAMEEITENIQNMPKEPCEFSCACDSSITRAYVLTKYMTACCSTGTMPIPYNGMLFNLCPGVGKHLEVETFAEVYAGQPKEPYGEVNPDERSWTTEILWQNVRHPYHSMLARGEAESLKVLFRYYRRFRELNRIRAKQYYGAEGQHNTEMTLSCGLQTQTIYGVQRSGRPDGYAENRWGGAVDLSPGLELVGLMLDYCDFTGDRDFFQKEVWPYLKDLLLYTQTRFHGRDNGKLVIGPLNSVETYWDTINPIPVVAGLHSMLHRVADCTLATQEQQSEAAEFIKILPAIPQKDGLLAPAEISDGIRHNVEVPELYTIFPFKNTTWYHPAGLPGKETFLQRIREFGLDHPFIIGEATGSPSYSGWQYVGEAAALLGLRDLAGQILRDNCALKNPGTRFPAMWGPVYDAVPDTDHGANILNQLQTMLLQTDGQNIYLLPAWPAGWDVEFQLYADSKTIISLTYLNGSVTNLSVTPDDRRKDVQICLK
jgi:hypothetical protein